MMIFERDIAIDLGTTNIRVFVRGKGIMLREPSIVAVDKYTGRMLKVGQDAQKMLGRTPANIVAIHPISAGVISDYDMTALMLKELLSRVTSFSLFKPRVLVTVPSSVTGVEERNVIDAVIEAGARKVYLVESAVATAAGAGADISKPDGHLVIDIGGGTTNVAMLSLGGIVVSKSLHLGSLDFNAAIKDYLRYQYDIVTDDTTVEEMKVTNGSAVLPLEDRGYYFMGRGLDDGLQREMAIKSSELYHVIGKPLIKILDLVKDVLRETPPELAADIMEHGIVLTGGGAKLKGMDQLFTQELGVPVMLASEPELAVAKGTGIAVADRDKLSALIEGAQRIYRRRF